MLITPNRRPPPPIFTSDPTLPKFYPIFTKKKVKNFYCCNKNSIVIPRKPA